MSIFQNGVFSCGFDFCTTGAQVLDGTNTLATSNAITRFGTGQSLNFGNTSSFKNLGANLATLIDGFAFYFNQALPSSGFVPIRVWYDTTGGAAQVSLQVGAQGQLQFFRGSGTGTPIGAVSANGIISAQHWIYLENKITFNSSSGSVECRANGITTPIISTGSLNTAPSGNNWVNRVYYTTSAGNSANVVFDDWYMLDMTGSAPYNDYLGNIRIQTDAPNADSATGGLNQFSTQPSQSAGSHYLNINPLPLVNDNNYNFDGTVSERESYRFPSLTGVKVLFLNEWVRAELDAGGVRTIEGTVRSNNVDAVSAPVTPSSNFGYFNFVSTIDPNTGSSWSVGTVVAAQSAELGVEIAS